MKWLFGAILFLSVAVEPALAGQGDSPAKADDTSNNTSVVTLSDDPHVKHALAFIDASGSKELLNQRIDTLMPMIMDLARRSESQRDDEFWLEFKAEAVQEMHNSVDGILLQTAQVYTKHFTDEELDAMTAFYTSEVGKKYLTERTAIVQETTAIGVEWGRNIGVEVA